MSDERKKIDALEKSGAITKSEADKLRGVLPSASADRRKKQGGGVVLVLTLLIASIVGVFFTLQVVRASAS